MKNGIAIIAAAVLAGFAPPRAAAALTVREATAGLGYAATSVNGAVFRAGSLTSLSNTQYIAYYDAEGYVVLGKRKERERERRKLQNAVKQVEQEIEALEAEIAAKDNILATGEAQSQDFYKEYQSLKDRLEQKMTEWEDAVIAAEQ